MDTDGSALRGAPAIAPPPRRIRASSDILRLLPRDTPGVVFYTLRQSFATAAALLVRVQDCAKAVWWQAEIAEAA